MKSLWMLIVLTLVTLLSQGCDIIAFCKDAELGSARQNNTSNRLRLAGYYYGDVTELNPTSSEVYLFYQNGVFYNYNSVDIKNAMSGQVQLDNFDLRTKHKSFWGIYKIENDFIEIRYWLPSINGCVKLFVGKGEILNDTTFKLISTKVGRGGDPLMVDDTFRFYPYSPKPDSIVNFIK